MKKLIYGVAINDADYTVTKSKDINGKSVKTWRCDYYYTWLNVLKRCLSESFKRKNEAYKDCSICDEWLVFSKFKSWMEKQDWEGNHLDKDLLSSGSKVYSPETCLFVSGQVNSFVKINSYKNSDLPIGVSFHKQRGKYRASVVTNKKQEHLGLFDNPEDAHEAWRARKLELAIELANSELVTDDRVRKALIARYQIE